MYGIISDLSYNNLFPLVEYSYIRIERQDTSWKLYVTGVSQINRTYLQTHSSNI
jgi:hypothetical protein